MKNLHLLPTENPSRLFKDNFSKYFISINIDQEQNHFTHQHIYISSDEEIKDGEYGLSKLNEIVKFHSGYDYKYYAKIILTTDQELINDGIQVIDDEFLEWFVKNPSCEWVKVESNKCLIKRGNCDCSQMGINCQCLGYKIIIPKEEPTMITDWLDKHGDLEIYKKVEKQLELEEAAKEFVLSHDFSKLFSPTNPNHLANRCFQYGANWQAERSYSEEEVQLILSKLLTNIKNGNAGNSVEWFEQFKKQNDN
jgi:hypothetical protein